MPPPRGLVQRFDQHLHRTALLPRACRLLVALSGGADSVALLRLLHAVNHSDFWRWELVVGHVDHGIRGPASAADARFSRALARELRLPFTLEKLQLGPDASEAAAREGRLRALDKMLRRKKCAAVVMAHHADDQAETVLLRITRGAGLEGAAAMGPRAAVGGLTLLRPLLPFRRSDLRDYLQQLGQEWRDDQTNAAPLYRRNRVRAEVMPAIEKIIPTAIEAMGRSAVLLAGAARYMDQQVAQAIDDAILQRQEHAIHLRRPVVQQWHPFLCAQVLRRLVQEVGGTTELADFERIQAAVQTIQATAGGKTIQMGAGVEVRAGGGVVTVEFRE